MNTKKKKETEIKEIQSPASAILPLFSNVNTVYSHPDLAIIDFGLLAPSYIEAVDYLEDTQIARICLPWSSAEELAEKLSESVKEHSSKRTKNKLKKD